MNSKKKNTSLLFKKTKNVYLQISVVRHASTDYTQAKPRVLQGQCDIDLNELGVEQAKALAFRLRKEKYDVIYSSDLPRAVSTAKEIIQYHNDTPVVYTKDLREQDVGVLEGLTWPACKELLFKEKITFEKKLELCGESTKNFYERVVNFYSYLINKYVIEANQIQTHLNTNSLSQSNSIYSINEFSVGSFDDLVNGISHSSSMVDDIHSIHYDYSNGKEISIDNISYTPTTTATVTDNNSYSALQQQQKNNLIDMDIYDPKDENETYNNNNDQMKIDDNNFSNNNNNSGGDNTVNNTTENINSDINNNTRISVSNSSIKHSSSFVNPKEILINKTLYGNTISLQMKNNILNNINGSNNNHKTQKFRMFRILVITHGGFIKNLIKHLTEELKFKIDCELQNGFPKNTGLYKFSILHVNYTDNSHTLKDYKWKGKVELMNCVSHLAILTANHKKELKKQQEEEEKRKKEYAASHPNYILDHICGGIPDDFPGFSAKIEVTDPSYDNDYIPPKSFSDFNQQKSSLGW